MAPPPPPSFRQRMRAAGSGLWKQASGNGVNLPTPTGLALAPIQGLTNLVGLGGIFQALQQQTATWFENTRRFNADSSRFRSLLVRDNASLQSAASGAGDLLTSSLRRAAQGQKGTLQQMMIGAPNQYEQDVFNPKGGADRVAARLGFSSGDITRLAINAAQSGLEGTGSDFKYLALLTGAFERGMNISAESQAQFLGGFGRNAGAYIKDGMRPAAQAARDLKAAVGQGISTQGAGLMSADVPAYLQEISTMMRAEARQGIKLSTTSVLGMGQIVRDESRDPRIFQGFAGLQFSQALMNASKGVMAGQGSALDQAMLFRQARKAGGKGSLFDTALMLEEGGQGGEKFQTMFKGYLDDLRATVKTQQERETLAVVLQRQGGIFGGMGLRQILGLLEGGNQAQAQPAAITDDQLMRRARATTDATQAALAGLDRAEVSHMQGRMETRVRIMKLESEVGRSLGSTLAQLEEASVKYVEAGVNNAKRIGNVTAILAQQTSGFSASVSKLSNAASVAADIIADTFSGVSTPTPAERAIAKRVRKKRNP